jgi:hypothetical protein
MGNSRSSPPPPPPPNRTQEINRGKELIKYLKGDISNNQNKLTQLLESYKAKRDEIKKYNNNLIPELREKYKKELTELNAEIASLKQQYIYDVNELARLIKELAKYTNDNDIIKSVNEVKKTNLSNMNKSNDGLQINIAESTNEYYNLIKNENTSVITNLEIRASDVENIKPEYIIRSTKYLEYLNNVFFFIYYLLVFLFAYFLNAKPKPMKIKAILIGILLLFPFFIYSFQDNLNSLYHNLYYFFFVN